MRGLCVQLLSSSVSLSEGVLSSLANTTVRASEILDDPGGHNSTLEASNTPRIKDL